MGKRREGERVVSVATDGIVSVFLSSELEFFSVSWLTVFYYYCRTTRDDFAIQLVGGGDPVSNAKLFSSGKTPSADLKISAKICQNKLG